MSNLVLCLWTCLDHIRIAHISFFFEGIVFPWGLHNNETVEAVATVSRYVIYDEAPW